MVMIKQILTSFAFVALSVASAATYKISFVEPSVVKGKELKAGDYQLSVKENSVVILKANKQQVEVPAKVENTNQKYPGPCLHRSRFAARLKALVEGRLDQRMPP